MRNYQIIYVALGVTLFILSNAQAQNTNCGIERWSVKVLTDADTTLINFHPIQSSVTEQTQLPKVVTSGSDTRLPSERNTYVVNALITQFKLESDGDLHLVIHDITTDSTMVAEIPNPDCPTLQGTSHVQQFATARQWTNDSLGTPKTSFTMVIPPKLVQIIGVGYYDPYHGQVGVAADNRELHPVLNISTPSKQGVYASPPSYIFCIYPNPARQSFNIYASVPDNGDEKILSLKITDERGVEVYSNAVNGFSFIQKIILSEFGSGVYVASMVTNKRIVNRNFIVGK